MAQPQWLHKEETRAWYAFIGAGALINRRLDQQLKEDVGITHLQYEILVRLDSAPDREVRMSGLADALYNSKSGLTYQITQMEKAGLVRRRCCPSDVRAVYAVITDDGRRMLERAAPGHVALVRELLIDVLTPQQLTTIADGLGEVNRRMQDGRPASSPR
ncbi:MarR family transcriptional regulator [Streptomyces sp. NBC_01537]|uniref:MarR family winged helix-turn-helix transcriptional regulator n=1 Tax=Streptomyces sp. NBC_01537 TaxID=2903896 RepID=UPI0038632591